MTQTPPPMPPQQPAKPKPWYLRWWAIAAAALIVISGIAAAIDGGTNDTSAPPPDTTQATTDHNEPADTPDNTPTPTPQPDLPTPEDIASHVAAGYKSTDDACINGITWLCNVETITVHNETQLQIEYRTLNDANAEPDKIARNWYNFLAIGNDPLMPDLNLVQVTANDGGSGSYNHNLN